MTNRIAELRKERRISQAELADEVDVTRQTIISWRTAGTMPRFSWPTAFPNTLG